MSNFWIVNKKNFFTPTLVLFVLGASTYLYSQPLRDNSQLYLFSYVFSILIFSVSVFVFNYYLIQKNFHKKQNLYVITNVLFLSAIVFFLVTALQDLTENIYPLGFITNFALANLILLIQFGINQKIKMLRVHLILFYVILSLFVAYRLQPDFLAELSITSIRLRQLTGFLFVGLEVFRLINISKLISKIFEGEK